MKRLLFLLVFMPFYFSKGIAQESYSMDLKSSLSTNSDFIVTFGQIPIEDGKLSLFFYRPATSGEWINMNMVNINPDGTVGECFEFELDSLKLLFTPLTFGLIRKNGYTIFSPRTSLGLTSFSYNNGSVVFAVNLESGMFKAWKTSNKHSLNGHNSLSTDSILFCTQAMADTSLTAATDLNRIGISAINLANDEILWSFRYMDSAQIGLYTRELVAFDNGHLAMLASSLNRNQLVKLNEHGDVINSTEILNNGQDYSLWKMHTTSSGDLLVYGIRTTLGEDRRGVIIKLNSSFEILWSRLIVIDNFDISQVEVSAASDDSIVFSCITYGDFPSILGRLSANGQLLTNQGYAIQGAPKVDEHGSLYLAGSFFHVLPNGELEHHAQIVKTDPDGNIGNCPQFDACVALEEIDIQTVPITVTREAIPHIEPTPVSVYPAEFYTEPYCVTPEPPNALFHLPERVCEGTCLSPDSIFNATANHVEWRILGTGLDTLIADTSFHWCFDVPGTYTVEQEVWVLGCSEFYARQLEVLPDDLAPPLIGDTILCQSPPYLLQPQSSRPLTSFLWSDGSTASVLSVNQGGVITLEASDGACTVRDTVELQFVEELLPLGPYTEPEDVGLCEQLLPYLYRPYSAYTNEFSLPGAEALPDGSFLLSEYGRYELSTALYGCPFSSVWELQELPCELPVYLPNAFSPNFDGFNDYLEPQGIDFEPIRLQVFDRWGGLLFQTNQAPFRWDGQRGNQAVHSGVYVVRFEYRNLRTGEVEEVVGDVTVFR